MLRTLLLTSLVSIGVFAEARANADQTYTMSETCVDLEGMRFYPPRALQRERTGRVELDCVIGSDLQLTECTIASEDPPGWEFGIAAVRIACRFRVQVEGDGSRRLAGASSQSQFYQTESGEQRVRVPVRFQLR